MNCTDTGAQAQVSPDGGGADADATKAGHADGHSRRALLGAASLQPGLLAAVYPGQYGILPIPSTWQVWSWLLVDHVLR